MTPDRPEDQAPAPPTQRGVVVPLKAEVYEVLPKLGVVSSFRAAFVGVSRVIASQRNMKLHMLSALMVMIVGMTLPFDLSIRSSLLFAVTAVWFAEILNTGLEALVDLFVRDFHRLAMLAKDAAAAGVLIISLGAVLIFADVVITRWDLVTNDLDAVWRSVAYGAPLVILEAIGLFALRRGALAVLRLAGSLFLLGLIAWHTTDIVFAVLSFVIVLVCAYARWAFPAVTGRGAPRQDPAPS